MAEVGVQLGITYIFEVVVYDIETGNEVAADSPPTISIWDAADPPVKQVDAQASTLLGGSTGTYRATIYLDPTWTEGEFLGEWSWLVSGNTFKPRFSFNAHLITLP